MPNSLGLVCSPVTTHGLIFDMDGVLFDSHPIHRRAWRQLLENLGIGVTDDSLDFILDGAKREEILEHFLGPLSQEEVAIYSVRKDAMLKTQEENLQLIAGLEAFLDLVEDAGLPKAVATSATKLRTMRLLDRFRLSNRFRAVISGDDVSSGKSNPAVFLKAAERLGVSPEDVLVVEDAIPAVAAAKNVDMKCIGIASGSRRSQLLAAGADLVVPDFRHLTLVDVLRLFSRGPSSQSFAR